MFLDTQKGESAQAAADRRNPTPAYASQLIPPPTYIFRERKIPAMTVTMKGLQPAAVAP